MCYNCGCGMNDDDMGNSDNITNKTVDTAAKASGQSKKEALKNIIEAAQKELKLAGKN